IPGGRRRARSPSWPSSSAASTPTGGSIPAASWGASDGRAQAHRSVRPLRLLPARLPDVPVVGRGDGLAARAHLPHEVAGRGQGAPVRRRRAPLRPLSRLHGLRHRLPVGRRLRRAHRANPRRGRAWAPPPARRPAVPRDDLRAVSPPAAAAPRHGGAAPLREAGAALAGASAPAPAPPAPAPPPPPGADAAHLPAPPPPP